MSTDSSNLLPAMRRIYIKTAFLAPAGHNYLLARLAFPKGMPQAGYFEAAQALEKYLKASLLMNGKSAVRPFEHGGSTRTWRLN
jgi:HEPN domain-containing protein